MTRKILAGCLAAAVLGGLAYYSSYLYSSKQMQNENIRLEKQLQDNHSSEQTEVPKEVSTEPASVRAETEDYAYYLVEEYGLVNIYLADKESIYEYTDISIDSLPEELQLEICTGKGIATERELYDFLENYSS